MHIGEKIRFIRDLKGIKQENMATLLNIKQPSWCKQEATGKIADRHWPEIEKILHMDKEKIEAAGNETELTKMYAGHQHNDNHDNVICVVNFTINGADKDTVDSFKNMFEHIMKVQRQTDK